MEVNELAKKKDKNDCPYCGESKGNNEIIGFDEDGKAIAKCSNCGKKYTIEK
jgi:DNA-directed RNA polymerase subunit RPC12/RpoP